MPLVKYTYRDYLNAEKKGDTEKMREISAYLTADIPNGNFSKDPDDPRSFALDHKGRP